MEKSTEQQAKRPFLAIGGGRAAAAGGGFDRVDFRRPELITQAQIQELERLFKRFLHDLDSTLSASFGCECSATPAGIRQASFEEFVESAEVGCAAALELSPSGNGAAMTLSRSVSFAALEVLLGARSARPPDIRRPLTEIERSVLEVLFEITTNELRRAWSSAASLDFKVRATDGDLASLRILSPAEPVLVFRAELQFGGAAGTLSIAIPSKEVRMAWRQTDDHVPAGPRDPDTRGTERMLQLLRRLDLRVEIRLQGPTLLVKQLGAMEVGDVLTFAHPVDRRLECLLNGRVKYRGQLVTTGGRLSFRVDEIADQA